MIHTQPFPCTATARKDFIYDQKDLFFLAIRFQLWEEIVWLNNRPAPSLYGFKNKRSHFSRCRLFDKQIIEIYVGICVYCPVFFLPDRPIRVWSWNHIKTGQT